MADGNDNSTNHTDSADSLIRRLGARYLVVLTLVALLMMVDQAVVQPLLVRLDAYAPAINLSGRQRMLSQKLTKAALALQIGDDEKVRSARRTELRETLDQWSRAQDALLHGDRHLGIRIIHSPEVEAQWDVLQPHFDAMCAAVSRLIDPAELHSNANATTQAVGQIAAHEAAFLSAMDQIVNLMESKAAHEINRLRACALAIAGVVLILLIGLGWFVVRPATRKIRRQVDDLESHVAQRTRDLADALASLQRQIVERESVEVKNKALSTQLNHADRIASMGHLTIGLSHELNQPLGAIANYAEACDVILSQPPESHRQSRLQENVDHIKRASLRAGQIIRRIRNFVHSSPSTTTDADINVLVQDVVALCRQEIVHAKVELTLDLSADDGVVSVDPIQIQQVLVNLVQNSLQAMQNCADDDRHLIIRTFCDFDTARVEVLDSGPGFEAADAEAIFEPFHTTKDEGLGIGLAICRSIVGNHNGTIWAESSSGNGAKFHLHFLLLNHMTPLDLSNPTVYVVDDDQEMRDSLCILLDVLGFQASAFATPGSFHRFYRPEMPGCLLLDIRMPRQTGLELYEFLLQEGKRLPVIFITAHADVSTAVAAMKTGAIEFLEKPFDRATLLDRVRKALALDAEWRAGNARFADLVDRVGRLSSRERETLAMIQAGESNKSMAAKLCLTERAVEMRRSAIMRKMRVRSVAELVDLAVTHRILAELREAAEIRIAN